MSRIVNLQDWKEEHPQSHYFRKKLFLTESQIRAYHQFKDSSPKEIIKFRS